MMQHRALFLIILTVSLLWFTGTATAQFYDYGHDDHGHYVHGHYGYNHHNHSDHGPGFGHGYYDHLHHGSVDHLTYPTAPAVQFYAEPVYQEPRYFDGLNDEVYCPESGYCPSESFNGRGFSATPNQPYPSPSLHGQTFNSQNHRGHDHAGHDHTGHSHASPAQPSENGYIPPPALSEPRPRQSPSQPDISPRPRQNQQLPQSRDAHEQEAPIQMDGPPPTIS